MAGSRFVSVPADRMVAHLEGIGAKVAAAGGRFSWAVVGRERVFHLHAIARDPLSGVVRIYTTLTHDRTIARGCGQDAVRVVVGSLGPGVETPPRFFPSESAQKVLRTAPQGPGDRVAVFLERLTGVLRDAYKRAQAVKACPRCGGRMRFVAGKFGPFLGCSNYPTCNHKEKAT